MGDKSIDLDKVKYEARCMSVDVSSSVEDLHLKYSYLYENVPTLWYLIKDGGCENYSEMLDFMLEKAKSSKNNYETVNETLNKKYIYDVIGENSNK